MHQLHRGRVLSLGCRGADAVRGGKLLELHWQVEPGPMHGVRGGYVFDGYGGYERRYLHGMQGR